MTGFETSRQPTEVAAAPSGGTAVSAPFAVARQVHLASGALPAAGAYTSQALQALPAGVKRVTYAITYTRGAAGGYPKFRHEVSNGTETMRNVLLQGTILPPITQPEFEMRFALETLRGPTPADGNPITYELTIELGANITSTRLLAAEGGVIGTPGTIAIARTADSGGAE